MEGIHGSRHRHGDSDRPPLEPVSYRNDGFTDDTDDRTQKKKKKQEQSSKRNFETDHRLRNAPKTAWNDVAGVSNGSNFKDVADGGDGGGAEENNGIDGRGRTVVDCETSFDSGPYVPQEKDELEKMVVGLERNMELVIGSLGTAVTTRERARQVASTAHLEVERRKEALVEAIDDYSRRLRENVSGQLSMVEAETDEATERLNEMLASMKKKSLEMRSQLVTETDSRTLKDQLLRWLTVWKESKAQMTFSFPDDLSMTDIPIEYADLHRLFGVSTNDNNTEDDDDVQTPAAVDAKAPTQSVIRSQHSASSLKLKYSLESQGPWSGVWTPHWKPPRLDSGKKSWDSSQKQLQSATLRIQNRIRESPQPVLTFSCRLTKDKRTCGITDLALTDEGQVLVLDRNNKAIKMFDSHGVLLKYFGKSELRKPSRISLIRSRGQVAVTDEATNRVLIFSQDGQFLSQLIALQRPVGHCQLTATRLAILEFSTRSVVICELEGKIISTFPTHLECPSYIASTKSENIIVTDWKSESFKIFDSTGSERFSYCYSTSAESVRHVVEPYGVCVDVDSGVSIVADRKKREVVFYSDDGTEVWSYDDAVNHVGVPFAVDCNGNGLLAIAEYTGTIRLFKYKTNDDDSERTTDATSANNRIYAASSEKQSLTKTSER